MYSIYKNVNENTVMNIFYKTPCFHFLHYMYLIDKNVRKTPLKCNLDDTKKKYCFEKCFKLIK